MDFNHELIIHLNDVSHMFLHTSKLANMISEVTPNEKIKHLLRRTSKETLLQKHMINMYIKQKTGVTHSAKFSDITIDYKGEALENNLKLVENKIMKKLNELLILSTKYNSRCENNRLKSMYKDHVNTVSKRLYRTKEIRL